MLKRFVPVSLRTRAAQWVLDEFARIYDRRGGLLWLDNTFWHGVPVQKFPGDLWVYQEIIVETRPDLIIETGTMHGGSALFFAHTFDLMGSDGRVISIDIEQRERPAHPRIDYVTASSTDLPVVARIAHEAESRRTMVVLDSDHAREHVAAELDAYADLVTPGCYLVVEDTIINGHPVMPKFGPGPWEAVDAFLPDSRFVVDPNREKFLYTSNRRGYLYRR